MLIYSTPFPCCPSCEMQADDAIPPREKERRGGGGGNRRRKKEKKKSQQTVERLFHSVAYCWHVRSYISCSWRACRSSWVHRTAGRTGGRVFQTPPYQSSESTLTRLPPAFSPGGKSIRKQTDNLKNQTKLSSPFVFIKTGIKANTGDFS